MSSTELAYLPGRYVFRYGSSRSRCRSFQFGRNCSSQRARGLSTSALSKRPRTALFFPGQGVQRVGMLDPWVSAFPGTARPFLDELDATLQLSEPLTHIIAKGPNRTLNATENSQPAIMATSILILRVLEQEFGFRTAERVDVTLGHSLGEFAALVAGGYLHFADAARMVRKRAEVMAACTRRAVADAAAAAAREKGSNSSSSSSSSSSTSRTSSTDVHGHGYSHGVGEFGMVALVCENEARMRALVEAIREFVEPAAGAGAKSDSADDVPAVQLVCIANINSKNQIVLSGSVERIYTLLANLRQFGGHDPRHVRLKSDSPFHSPLMKPAQDAMRRIFASPSAVTGEDMIAWPGYMPCVSNVTGRPFRSREELKDLVSKNCVETVQWWSSVRYLDQQEKVRRWVGLGPGKVGRNLVGKEVGMKGKVKGGGVWAITMPKEIDEVLRGLEETEMAEEED